jgi:hypothetical protein
MNVTCIQSSPFYNCKGILRTVGSVHVDQSCELFAGVDFLDIIEVWFGGAGRKRLTGVGLCPWILRIASTDSSRPRGSIGA